MKSRRAFVDELIVFAFCIIIAGGLLWWAGIAQSAPGVVLGLVVIALLIIIVFRNRIKRQISESLN